MTRRGPRGAENQGEEREKTTGSSRRRGGDRGEEKYNSRFRLFPIITLPSLSVKC